MKVLFCADGSPGGLAALERAAGWLRGGVGEATVLYVVPEVDDRFRHYQRLHEEELQDIERLFGDAGPGIDVVGWARAALRGQGVEAGRRIREGDPAEEILAEVREGRYDLVVLGSSGRSRLERVLLGSVARRVSQEAEASVLLVRPVPGEGVGGVGRGAP